MALESEFKKDFLFRLKNQMLLRQIPIKFIHTRPHHRSFPDVIVLCGKKWAGLEFKRSANASAQPNQSFYVDLFDEMSFARFVYPDNAEDVLNDLERLFTSG